MYKIIFLTSIKDRQLLQSGHALSLYFITIWGRQLVRQGQFYFVLVCFVLFWCYSCVYNISKPMKVLFTDSISTTAVLDLLIRILSAPNKILCVLLVSVTIFTTFALYLQGYSAWSFSSILSRLLIVQITSISQSDV